MKQNKVIIVALLALLCFMGCNKQEKYTVYWTFEGLVEGDLSIHIETQPEIENPWWIYAQQHYYYSLSKNGFLLEGGRGGQNRLSFKIDIKESMLDTQGIMNNRWYCFEKDFPNCSEIMLYGNSSGDYHLVSGRFNFVRSDSQNYLIAYSLLFDCTMVADDITRSEPDTIHITSGKVDIYKTLDKLSYTSEVLL